MPTLRECPVCGLEVDDDAPMIGARIATERSRGRRRWTEVRRRPICQACARSGRPAGDDQRVMIWAVAHPDGDTVACETCGLPVVLAPDPRRKTATCSDSCRTRYYAQRRVITAVTLACEGCGREMTGRTDRRFCSPACRQRAYRARQAAGGSAYLEVIATADDATFEASISAAVADGDVSRENVERHVRARVTAQRTG